MGDFLDQQFGEHRYRIHPEDQVLSLAVSRDGIKLQPTLDRFYRPFVSASVLAQKAKQFDDGLYAAVELAAQRGLGTFKGKQALLVKLLEHLRGEGEARALLEAAAALGRGESPTSESAIRVHGAFLADESRAKPVSFYSWREGLGWVFRQDRLLQTDLAGCADLIDLARAVHGDTDMRAAYEQSLVLASRLTNPLACADLRSLLRPIEAGGRVDARARVSFFPPSVAHETELVKRLYGDRPIPEDFDVLGAVIHAIRNGTLDLKPRATSGYYDVQTWSLETLAAPACAAEASRLVLDETYGKSLEALFRGILTLTRETHIKQLEWPAAGASPQRVVKIPISPGLTVEPLVTHYSRRAEAYRFVRGVIEEAFGESALGEMHRLRADGQATQSLRDELGGMIALFDGAAATAMRELGMPTDRDPKGFTSWASSPDPDINADARAMVPVYHDRERNKTKVLLFLGWSQASLNVSFATRPRVEMLTSQAVELDFTEASYQLASPVVAEALVSRIFDRDEFREHCDRYRTTEAIVNALA